MATNTFTPPVLDLTVDRYAAWKSWLDKWNDYKVVTDLASKSPVMQCSTLRYTFTDETRKIYNSLSLAEDAKNDPEQIINALQTFARGIVNETLERHAFNCRIQESDECFDDYITDIKILSKNCGYCNNCHDSLLRDKIVSGICDDAVRRKLLSETDLTLKKAEDICRAKEKANEGARTLTKPHQGDEAIGNVNQTRNRYPSPTKKRTSTAGQNKPPFNNRKGQNPCKFCNNTHKFGRENCPAYGKTCTACGFRNHSQHSILCRKRLNAVQDEDELLDEAVQMGALFLGAVNSRNQDDDSISWEIEMPAKTGSIMFKIDTGADVTVISENELPKMGMTHKDIEKTRKKLLGPSGEKLRCIGYIRMKLTWGEKSKEQICYVCKDITKNLLGRPSIMALDILKMNKPENVRCDRIESEAKREENIRIMKQRPQMFNSLGKIVKFDPIKIRLHEGTTPSCVGAPRHIAIPLLQPLIDEIKRMETLKVIRLVDGPTEWCHPIVPVVKTDGSIRICIDLTRLNKGVKRELYQLESCEETIAKLGDSCKVMSKIDLNSGYWQMPLDEESQTLTTFITPIGRYCMTVGPFGLSSMQEIFNKRIDCMIEGLKGVAKSTDDLMAYGKDDEEHDRNLSALLDRLEEYGVTLNAEKCIFKTHELEFLGLKISPEGIRPIQSKINAIEQFETPTNVTELKRFMGMAQQMAKHHEKFAHTTEPLRNLLSTKNDWIWTEHHDEAFKQTKILLADPTVLKLYDYRKPTKLRVDGSQLNGIGVIMYQWDDSKWWPVTCASRYLSSTEKRYHNIEVEMLAVTWGIEKMKMYLHGLPHFTVQTDHKPLIPILNDKPIIDMSSRIQRMRMKLLPYNFTAEYVRGQDLADADALSRKPLSKPTRKDEIAEDEIEAHINGVIQMMPATNSRLQEIASQTKTDEKLQEVLKVIHTGWPENKDSLHEAVKPYWYCRQNLTEHQGLILNGNRIVIPDELRKDIIIKLHKGHQGMEKMKRRARQSCYWPHMNNQIEQKVRKCNPCLTLAPSKSPEQLKPPPLPTRSWQKVGSDLFEAGGKHYVVITDYYSLWPEVYLLKQANSQHTIEALEDTFSRHGIPDELMTDNGTQYMSKQFRRFKKEWQFVHSTSSPRFPQSNGLSESSVKTVKSMIIKCSQNNESIRKGLLIIRNTPLQCGYSPAELLMNRQLQDNLPRIKLEKPNKSVAKRNIKEERTKQQTQFNKKVCERNVTNDNSSEFKQKQIVAIQHHSTKEWSLRGTIIEKVAPRSYTIKLKDGTTIRRNTINIRKVYSLSIQNNEIREIPNNNTEQDNEENTNTDDSFDTIPYEDGDTDSEGETIPYDEDDIATHYTDDDSLDIESEEDIHEEPETQITRSGRVVKKNVHKDYLYQTLC